MSGCADSYQECGGDSRVVVDPGDHLASDSSGNILFCKIRSSEFPTNLNPPDPGSKWYQINKPQAVTMSVIVGINSK